MRLIPGKCRVQRQLALRLQLLELHKREMALSRPNPQQHFQKKKIARAIASTEPLPAVDPVGSWKVIAEEVAPAAGGS